ncbi:MAG TPA: Ppx/GppA family phosphatase, partial [Prevotella sp.]
MKTLASIDIGSNGARLLIKTFEPNVENSVVIRKVIYLRIPLRLGEDVFSIGKISKSRQDKMKHMLKAFKQLMRLHNVDDYRACATAAMRDATNGDEVIRRVHKQTGIQLDVIKGKEEALLLRNNIIGHPDYQHGNFAFIDVGGGSTEVSIIT